MSVAHRAVLLVSLLTLGCVDPEQVNTVCEWSAPDRVLDLSSRSDRAHLREDARLIGELEVRYADARRKTPSEMERYVDECRAHLVPLVTAAHHISAADLEAARHWRNWPVDIALVFLPMAVLAIVAVNLVVRFACGMFDPDSRAIARAITAVLVLLTSALVVGITQIWGFTVEGLLLRNGHVSFRAFYSPPTVHGWITLFISLTLCISTAAWRFPRTPLSRRVGAYRPGMSIRRV